MIRDITIGQYYPTDSVIHRLDPRTKLVWTLVYIFSLFLSFRMQKQLQKDLLQQLNSRIFSITNLLRISFSILLLNFPIFKF